MTVLSNCNLVPRGRNGVEVSVEVDSTELNDADFNNLEGEYSVDGGTTWFPVPSPNDSLIPGGDIFVPAQFTAFGYVVWPLVAGQSVLYRVNVLVNNVVYEQLVCGPVDTHDYPTVTCAGSPASLITSTSASINVAVDNFPTGQFNNFPAGTFDPSNQDQVTVVYGTTPGGPYPFTAGPVAIGNGGGAVPLAGLTPNTQYYYRIQVSEEFETAGQFLDVGECTFTTLSGTVTPECSPATFIQFTQADIQGTVDNLVAPNKARVEWGTTPGGPYPNASGYTIGDNTVDQLIPPVPFSATGLTPGTYYYRVSVHQSDNTFIEASAECSFTVPASTVDCAPATNITATTVDLNGIAHSVLPNWIILIDVATTPGGPYTQYFGANGDGNANQPFTQTLGVLTPNTTYYYRWTIYDEIANNVYTGPECATFQTLSDILVDPCEPATNVDYNSATLHGTAENVPAGHTRRFRYGTTPGGPYPNILPAGVFSGATPESYQADTGNVLTPNIFYYYISEVLDPGNNVVAESPVECQFTTEPAPLFGCGPTTNVTGVSASIGANYAFVPVGHTIEWKYGIIPGSPDHSAGPVAASGGTDTDEVTIFNLIPDTNYCYTAYLFDENHNLVATSDECCFTTLFAYLWCGGFHSPDECFFVDPGNGEPYLNCNFDFLNTP